MTDFFALLNEPRRPALDAERLRQKFLALAAEVHPDRVHNASEVEKAAANRHYAELNAACQCLTDPKTRLLHLLELERGSRPVEIQTIPPALADWFVGIAAICREADTFLLDREKVTSPLLKIKWFERAQAWIERLQEWQKNLGTLRAGLDARLELLDQQWQADCLQSERPITSPATRSSEDNSPSPKGAGRGEGEGQQTIPLSHPPFDVVGQPNPVRPPALLARLEELYRFYGYFNRWQNQLSERIARLSF